ncbi:hypothetical protein ACR75P_05085 [Faecalicoccus pleomorphus]|uniref:hypothetical protein n=1 Tax=Faecalicoccus pleomorphus TaxID=1323 RepID=UPI003DA57E41
MMRLLDKAYVNAADIAYDLGLNRKTVLKKIEAEQIAKYDIGYRSSEIIKKFGLKDWIELKMKIENKKAPHTDQSDKSAK